MKWTMSTVQLSYIGSQMSQTGDRFAKNLIIRRKARGISQGMLANYLGINPSTVSHWETRGSIPDGEVIDLICGLLECDPEDLYRKAGPDKHAGPLPRPNITLSEACDIINALGEQSPIIIRPRRRTSGRPKKT